MESPRMTIFNLGLSIAGGDCRDDGRFASRPAAFIRDSNSMAESPFRISGTENDSTSNGEWEALIPPSSRLFLQGFFPTGRHGGHKYVPPGPGSKLPGQFRAPVRV